MSTSTALSRPSMAPRYIIGLSQVLQDANIFYVNIARAIRATQRPTFHAKMRAKRLGLRVDIDKAVSLSQKYISTIALPIIVQHLSPVSTLHQTESDEGKYFNGPTVVELRKLDAVLSLLSESKSVQEICRTDSGDALMYLYKTPSAWDQNQMSVGGSSSASTTSTLVSTPGDSQDMPLKIRIKRKIRDIEETGHSIEKRPKYGRKDWANSIGSQSFQSKRVLC